MGLVNPFQFTLGFKEAYAKGLGKAANIFSGIFSKSIAKTNSNVDNLAASLDKLVGVAEGAQKLFKTALGFAGVSLAIGGLSNNIREFDQEFSNLVMITGSTSQATKLQDWFDDVGSKANVTRGDLTELTKVGRKFNATVTDLDVAGLSATAKLTGTSIAGLTEQIGGLTQTMKLSYQEAVAKSIELTGTTKNADKIMQAFNTTAFNSEDRFKALSKVMAGVVPPDMRLASTSLNDMAGMIGNIMSSFGRAFAGDPMKSGPIYEIRMAMKDLLSFLQDNMASIKMVFSAIGKVIGSVIKFIVDIAGKMISKLSNLFSSMKMSTEDFNKTVVLPFITFLEIIKAKVMGWIDSFVDGLTAGFSGLYESIAPYIEEIKKQVGPLLDALGFGENSPSGNGFWKGVGEVVGSVLSTIIELGTRLVSKVLPHLIEFIVKMKTVFASTFEKLGEIWNKVVNIFSGGSGKSEDAFKALEFVIDAVAGTIGVAFDVMAFAISTAVDIIIFVLNGIVSTIEWVVVNFVKMKDGIKGIFDTIKNTVTNVWDKVKGIFEKITNFFKKDLTSALETIEGLWSSVFGEDSENTINTNVNTNTIPAPVVPESGSGASLKSVMAIKNASNNVVQQPPLDLTNNHTTKLYIDGKEVAAAVDKSKSKQEYR